MPIKLTSSLAGVAFANPLLNAAGVHCATPTELDEVLASAAGGVVTKSATLAPRDGNARPRFQALPLGSINSMGLPNQGFDAYLAYACAHQHAATAPVILSLAGLSLADDLAMLRRVQESDFTGLVELNLSCPNVPGKPQVAYDFAAVTRILDQAFQFFTKRLGIKLPPYLDLAQFDALAAILNRYPLAYVNAINSLGNGLVIDPLTERPVIRPKGGFGGIGGAYVKPTALANVRAWRERLNPTIGIIGTGGVRTGTDVFEHLLCGADLVQVGTALATEGPAIFARLTRELTAVMATKGYQTLADFRGKLQVR